jgi:transcriptional regulator GlxA family with amidase domain
VVGPLDTLHVAGGRGGHESPAGDHRLLTQVRRLAAVSALVASVCTGATVPAAAGLLDGRRATPHRQFANRLAERHSVVRVDPAPLSLRVGTSTPAPGSVVASISRGAGSGLATGRAVARVVVRSLVTYLHRPGNQAQVSLFVSAPPPEHRLLADLAAHIGGAPDADLSAPAPAARAGMSVRRLTRLVDRISAAPPGRHVRAVRDEAAAQLPAAIARGCAYTNAPEGRDQRRPKVSGDA